MLSPSAQICPAAAGVLDMSFCVVEVDYSHELKTAIAATFPVPTYMITFIRVFPVRLRRQQINDFVRQNEARKDEHRNPT